MSKFSAKLKNNAALGAAANNLNKFRSSNLGNQRRSVSVAVTSTSPKSEKPVAREHMIYDETHFVMQKSLGKLIEEKINPNVAKWEQDGRYPAHLVFKMLGDHGVFGVNKPEGNTLFLANLFY